MGWIFSLVSGLATSSMPMRARKQGQDGRWVLEKTPGNMHTGFGTRERPNKWVTLNAMRVLKRVYG